MPAETTAAARRARPHRIGALVGAVIFLGFGLAALVAFFGVPAARMVAARRWTELQCTILASQVKSHHDGTYSVEVRYRYESGGATRTGTRYQFMGGSSSGREGKQEIVDGLRPESRVPCYVNPRDPDDAVIERGPTGVLLFGLIPGVFVLVGLFMVVSAVRYRPATETAAARTAAGLPADADADGPSASTAPRTLRQRSSPGARFAAMLIVAALWNGIVAVFVVGRVDEWQRGGAPIVATLFLLPFVGVGIFLVGTAGKHFLAIFGPRAVVTLTPGILVLGQQATVEWRLTGRAEWINGLTVTLEGREEATYVRGTDRRTDTAVFARIPIDQPSPGLEQARRGTARFQVPSGSMHSFVSRNNKIVWFIRAHGQIDRWPDLDEEYPVTVLPPRERRA